MKRILSVVLCLGLLLGTVTGTAWAKTANVYADGGTSSPLVCTPDDLPPMPKPSFPPRIQAGVIVVVPSPQYYQAVSATAAAQPGAALADAGKVVWNVIKWAVSTVAGDRLIEAVKSATGGHSSGASSSGNTSHTSNTNNASTSLSK